MKTILTLTAAFIGGIALPVAVFAGPTETITGCATVAVEGTNYTVRSDVTCALSENKDGSTFILAGLAAVIEDMADEEEETAK